MAPTPQAVICIMVDLLALLAIYSENPGRIDRDVIEDTGGMT
jgi:hypothetical protein